MLPDIEKLVESTVRLSDKFLKAADNSGVFKFAMMGLTGFLIAQAAIAFFSTAASIANIGIQAFRAAALIWEFIPAITSLTDVVGLLDICVDEHVLPRYQDVIHHEDRVVLI